MCSSVVDVSVCIRASLWGHLSFTNRARQVKVERKETTSTPPSILMKKKEEIDKVLLLKVKPAKTGCCGQTTERHDVMQQEKFVF